MTRVGVVGHVEWVQFAVVERVPRVRRDRPRARDVRRARGRRRGRGGAAAQARRRGALPDRARRRRHGGARRAAARRARRRAARRRARPAPQRRTFTFLDDAGERTITVLGERIVPWASDPLPWEGLARPRRDLLHGRRCRRGARRTRGARARRDAARDGGARRVGRAARRARPQRDRSRRGLRAGDARSRRRASSSARAARWAARGRGETSGAWDATPLPGRAGRRLRLRRLVRRGARVRSRRGDGAARGDRPRRRAAARPACAGAGRTPAQLELAPGGRSSTYVLREDG